MIGHSPTCRLFAWFCVFPASLFWISAPYSSIILSVIQTIKGVIRSYLFVTAIKVTSLQVTGLQIRTNIRFCSRVEAYFLGSCYCWPRKKCISVNTVVKFFLWPSVFAVRRHQKWPKFLRMRDSHGAGHVSSVTFHKHLFDETVRCAARNLSFGIHSTESI